MTLCVVLSAVCVCVRARAHPGPGSAEEQTVPQELPSAFGLFSTPKMQWFFVEPGAFQRLSSSLYLSSDFSQSLPQTRSYSLSKPVTHRQNL